MSDDTTPSVRSGPPAIVGEIARRNTLLGINLIACNATLISPMKIGERLDNMGIQAPFGIQRGGGPNCFTAFLGINVLCLQKSGPPVASISCTFAANYRVEEELYPKLSDEDLVYYAAYYAPVNLWPYVREHVQSTGSKMSLGLVTVPFFSAVFDAEKNAKDYIEQIKKIQTPAVAP